MLILGAPPTAADSEAGTFYHGDCCRYDYHDYHPWTRFTKPATPPAITYADTMESVRAGLDTSKQTTMKGDVGRVVNATDADVASVRNATAQMVDRIQVPLLDRANLTGLVLGCIEAKFCK